MRLGGAVVKPFATPEEWLAHVKEVRYSAVVFPLNADASLEERRAYQACAKENDLAIAEVGVWRNVMAPDEQERKAAIDLAVNQLALADDIGAHCCVNICGTPGSVWDGYHPDNFSADTYALAVDTTRAIIDAVKPTRTFYTLEPMPWMLPNSPEQYLDLIRDIDRPAFAAHLDFVNMINSFDRYHNSADFIRSSFQLLGPHIKSIHAKDARLEHHYACCISEVLPGQGGLDLGLVLQLAHALGDDMTVFLDHLRAQEDCVKATGHMRKVAVAAGVPVKG